MNQKSLRGVQQSQVDAAADALLAERLRPTVERIRQKLGRGSPNTVGPLLETWFANLAPRLGVQVLGVEVVGLPSSVRAAMESLWGEALRHANEEATTKLSKERDALANERLSLATHQADLLTQAAELTRRENILTDALQQAKLQAEDLAVQVRQLNLALQQRDEAINEARSSIANLVQAKDAALLSHRVELQSAARERQEIHDHFAANERRLLSEVDRARHDAKNAKKAIIDTENKLNSEREMLQEQILTLQRANTELQIENAAFDERLIAAEKRANDFHVLLMSGAKKSAVAPKATRRKS